MFLTPSKRKLDVNVVQSNFHIELTPSDVGNYDRVVIQDLLKEIAQTQQVDLNAKQRFKGELSQTSNFETRVWVLPTDNVTPSNSCRDQRSGLALKRCSSRAPSDNGKVHVKHAHDSLCEQYLSVDRANQEPVLAYTGRGSQPWRGLWISNRFLDAR